MNANELADELERLHEQDKIDGVADLAMPEAATMLRQLQAENEALRSLSLRKENLGYFYDLHASQQAEIEALKKKIQNMALDLLSAHAQADDHWVELERLRKAQEK